MRHHTGAVIGYVNSGTSTGSVHVEGAFLSGRSGISAITESLTGQALSLIYTPTTQVDLGESGLTSTPDDGTDTINGHCSITTTATTSTGTFDDADRITTTGYTYDTLGRTSTTPAADAQGIGATSTLTGTLTTNYYANDMVANINQGGSSITYTLDPLQNRIGTETYGASVTTYHYSGDGDSPAWTEASATSWTRNLTAPGGQLAGTQTQAASITLRLANLHGDIVATAANSSTATGISSYTESTEFGAPRTPANGYRPYGYLGALQRSGNALGGVILMGVRLYNPTTGRFLSVDPIYGGNDNPYAYPTNPIDGRDLDGKCGFPGLPWHKCDGPRYPQVTDRYGNSFNVRPAIQAKLLSKHNLKLSTVQRFFRVATAEPESGTVYDYHAYAIRYRCSGAFLWRSCTEIARQQIFAVVDTRNLSDGNYGLVTAYCVGLIRCPDWVNSW